MADEVSYLNPKWVQVEITRLICRLVEPDGQPPYTPIECAQFSSGNNSVMFMPPVSWIVGAQRLLMSVPFDWSEYEKTVKRRRRSKWDPEHEFRENYWRPVAEAIVRAIARVNEKGRKELPV